MQMRMNEDVPPINGHIKIIYTQSANKTCHGISISCKTAFLGSCTSNIHAISTLRNKTSASFSPNGLKKMIIGALNALAKKFSIHCTHKQDREQHMHL